MGIGDFVEKAKDLVSGNSEKVKDGIDKGADVADDKTGGKYSGQIDQGADAAKDAVDGLDGEK
jgi:hypothetical protein